MKSSLIFGSIGLVAAHKPVPESHWANKAVPPTYDVLAAIGEAYHNAWKHCNVKTTDWVIGELGIEDSDPTFDNAYYVEYQIKKKVPRVYEIFQTLLGEDNYWPAPVFTTTDTASKYRVSYGEMKTSNHAQVLS
jgi:hypothetical protein